VKKFTLEELADYTGETGGPTYVAYKGKVYDVSSSPSWPQGDHQGMHTAGHDMSEEILDAPHEPDVLEEFPVVGEID